MYLIIGASGFLGSYMIKNIIEHTDDRIIACARNISRMESDDRIEWLSVDISSEKDVSALIGYVESQSEKSLKVLFLAAYHNPDRVAEFPDIAWNINVTCLSRCINMLRSADKLFYASTDSVYGNSADGYAFRETDALSPVNEYGRQKCASEAIVTYAGFNVVRYPFLIGKSLAPGKEHFYDVICRELRNGRNIEMFSDSYRSSLDFDTAADLLIRLCEYRGDVPQILNVCGDKALSKYDIGLMIAGSLGVPETLVIPAEMEKSKIFASAHALSTIMDNSRLRTFLGTGSIDLKI